VYRPFYAVANNTSPQSYPHYPHSGADLSTRIFWDKTGEKEDCILIELWYNGHESNA
jgi:hypothetical protein